MSANSTVVSEPGATRLHSMTLMPSNGPGMASPVLGLRRPTVSRHAILAENYRGRTVQQRAAGARRLHGDALSPHRRPPVVGRSARLAKTAMIAVVTVQALDRAAIEE